jgi:hypothetical protein
LTPGGGLLGFLPFVATSAQLNESEVGDTVTPFGVGLGLSNSDVNGNASHDIFVNAAGMNVVDMDSQGHILSLAVRANVTSGGVGVVPEPGSLVLASPGAFALLLRCSRYRKSR